MIEKGDTKEDEVLNKYDCCGNIHCFDIVNFPALFAPASVQTPEQLFLLASSHLQTILLAEKSFILKNMSTVPVVFVLPSSIVKGFPDSSMPPPLILFVFLSSR